EGGERDADILRKPRHVVNALATDVARYTKTFADTGDIKDAFAALQDDLTFLEEDAARGRRDRRTDKQRKPKPPETLAAEIATLHEVADSATAKAPLIAITPCNDNPVERHAKAHGGPCPICHTSHFVKRTDSAIQKVAALHQQL